MTLQLILSNRVTAGNVSADTRQFEHTRVGAESIALSIVGVPALLFSAIDGKHPQAALSKLRPL